MNHDAINRMIHEIAYPGKCWHDVYASSSDEGTNCYMCRRCDKPCDPNPSYTTDLNAAYSAWSAWIRQEKNTNAKPLRLCLTRKSANTTVSEFCIDFLRDIVWQSGGMPPRRLEEFKKLLEEK